MAKKTHTRRRRARKTTPLTRFGRAIAHAGRLTKKRRSAIARKAARTRKANAAIRSAAAKKAARTRKSGGRRTRKTGSVRRARRSRHRGAYKRTPKWQRAYRRGGRSVGRAYRATARRSKRARRGYSAYRWAARHRPRTARGRFTRGYARANPGRRHRRRGHRRIGRRIYRRNPFGLTGALGGVAATLTQAVVAGVGFFGARALANAVRKVPIEFLKDKPYSPTLAAGVLFGAAWFLLPKSGMVGRYRDGLLVGFGLNVVDQAIKWLLPEGEVKKMIAGADGLGGDIYGAEYKYLPAAGVGAYYQQGGVGETGLMEAPAGAGLMEAPAGLGAYYQTGPASGLGAYFATGVGDDENGVDANIMSSDEPTEAAGLFEAPASYGDVGGDDVTAGWSMIRKNHTLGDVGHALPARVARTGLMVPTGRSARPPPAKREGGPVHHGGVNQASHLRPVGVFSTTVFGESVFGKIRVR